MNIKESIEWKMQYPRDYIYPILLRYVSRYGFISKEKAFFFYKKVCDRYGWQSGAYWYYPDFELDKYGSTFADGDFCKMPFSVVYHFDRQYCEVVNASVCDYCGSETKDIRVYGPNNEIDRYTPGVANYQCTNKLCVESREFMYWGFDEYTKRSQESGVPLKRPLKQYQKADPQTKLALASAALLDFEARCIQKAQKLQEQACP